MSWNPWTGCKRKSEGCLYCYYYGVYSKHQQNNIIRADDKEFYKPLYKDYKILATCFKSDFFLEEADTYRYQAWSIIKQKPNTTFLFLTKRIERFYESLIEDYDFNNVRIGCSVENQKEINNRLPIYVNLPIKHKWIVCAPLLEKVDLTPYLSKVECVVVGGETGKDARILDFDYVLDIRQQCINSNISFQFRSTGTNFKKEGIIKKINPFLQAKTAKELNINITLNDVDIIFNRSNE